MATITQQQDADREKDVRGAMQAAAGKITRDQSQTKELQAVAKMIADFCGGTRGLDQMANLKTLAGVKLKDDTNLTNLNAAIRDAGMAVLRDYIARAQPRADKPLSDKDADSYVEDKYVCGLLRNALAIGGDENGLKRVRAAIKKLEGGN